MDKPTCATCPFWKDQQHGVGQCRIKPPHYEPANTIMGAYTQFPASRSGDWCGEHPDFKAWLDSQKPAICDEEDRCWKRCVLQKGHEGPHAVATIK